jgi:hypothetical protein
MYNVEKIDSLKSVLFTEDNVTIDMGLLDKIECEKLAIALLQTIDSLMKDNFTCQRDYDDWLIG